MQTSIRTDRWPDFARKDAGVVMITRWRVPSPEAQRAAADATAEVWARNPWPEGVLSYSLFAGEDGRTILNHSQWTSLAAYHAFVESERAGRNRAIDDAVPGIERIARFEHRHYASRVLAEGSTGCVVDVEIEAAPAEDWVKLALAAIDESGPPSGALAAHFHVDEENGRAFNLAQWTSADAHHEALARDALGRSPAWQRVRDYAGARFAVSRYERLVSMHPAG